MGYVLSRHQPGQPLEVADLLPQQPRMSQSASQSPTPRQLWICRGILALAFVFCAWRSWRTWPDILVDFGHELYIPWRLSEGEALYRDIHFTMGPLSQCFNGLLFRVFGASLTALICANLAILVVIIVLLFWLFCRCGTLWSATCVTLFFILVFAFGQYTLIGNYNYVCPYRHEITHGLVLGLAQVACLIRAIETRRRFWLILAGMLLGLVWLTKFELVLPAVAVTVAAAILSSRRDSEQRPATGNEKEPQHREDWSIPCSKSIVSFAQVALVAAATVALTFSLLATAIDWQSACEAVFNNARYSLDLSLTVNNGFYRSVSGMDELPTRLLDIALVTIVAFSAITIAYLIDRVMTARLQSRWPFVVVGMGAGILAASCITSGDFLSFPAPLPFLLPIVVVMSGLKYWRNATEGRSTLTLNLLAVFAISLLPKILLNVRWAHYGFVLAMPGTLLLVHLLIHTRPQYFIRDGSRFSAFRSIAVGILMTCAGIQFLTWNRIGEQKVQPVGEGADLFYADPFLDDRVSVTVQTIDLLRTTMKPHDTLCVIPEGSTLNYLLRKRNPTGLLMFNPWELDVYGGESRVCETLTRTLPDFIFLVHVDAAIFGRGEFGGHAYGEAILEFIKSHYRAIETMTQTDQRGSATFFATVYQRLESVDQTRD